MRIDKFICDTGLLGRRDARQYIRDGRVSVNGAAAASCDAKIDPEHDRVEVDGAPLTYSRFHYYVMNKPAGILTATEDKRQKTVLDLLPPELRRQGVFPVGRLDKDTTGLLLLTDDGDFAHRVISPKSEIKKVYRAHVDGEPTGADADAFAAGLVLGDGTKCLPAKLEILGGGDCLVTVMEGKYHQVKRMLASRGLPVKALHRLSVGGLRLDEKLAPGEFRKLEDDQLCIVMNEK